AQAASDCADQGSCLDAVMAAARAGHEIDEIMLMKAMGRQLALDAPKVATRPALPPRVAETQDVGNVDLALTGLMRNIDHALGALPDYHRALALTYLKTGHVDEARRLLEDAVEAIPLYAPYWMDLAIVYARQGQHERAVSALVVAEEWTDDQAALRQAYRQAASDTPEAGLGPDYTAAMQLIDANAAEQAREVAALPPMPPKGTVQDPSRKAAVIDFNTCDKPLYPKVSMRYKETGTVTVYFLVDAHGTVRHMRKTKSSGHASLDNAAAFSLATCHFQPATLDGKPVASWQPVQYVWTLD
ncbi:MAG TPA: TonB family protein, partial [Telluria sp.]